MFYILDGHTPVKVDEIEFSKWFDKNNRKVRETYVNKVTISTVFLGLDHNWGRGTPTLFETMVFGGTKDGFQRRYKTWDEAVKGHEEILKEFSERCPYCNTLRKNDEVKCDYCGGSF